MSGTAQAFWVTGAGSGEIRTETLPVRRPDQVLVRTLYTGISRGTETLVFTGGVPPSEYQRMRAPHQQGEFPGPVKYGYTNVGLVEEGSPALVGKRVFALYPHQSAYVVESDAVTVLPSDVPSERAVLTSNLETAINGIWDAELKPGDRVAVIGAGVVGLLVAYLAARIPGCEVQVVDVDPQKRAFASELGATFALPNEAAREMDVIVHASGVPAGLETALELAAPEASIVEMSWYGSKRVQLDLGASFHARRLTIRSSQVGQIPASQRTRWTYRRRLELALRLLADPRLDRLITGESPFSQLPEVMPRLVTPDQPVLCHRIHYPEN